MSYYYFYFIVFLSCFVIILLSFLLLGPRPNTLLKLNFSQNLGPNRRPKQFLSFPLAQSAILHETMHTPTGQVARSLPPHLPHHLTAPLHHHLWSATLHHPLPSPLPSLCPPSPFPLSCPLAIFIFPMSSAPAHKPCS